MDNFDSKQLPTNFEQSIESDTSFFNSKFPAVGNWVSVELQPEEFSDISEDTIDYRPNRLNVTVRVINDAPNAPTRDDSIFVCYYTLGDSNGRDRAEGLLGDIYEFFNVAPST